MGKSERGTGDTDKDPWHGEISAEEQERREGRGRGLTSEVALLGEGDPQVAVVAAKAVGEEGREGGRVLPQELPPPGQLLQGQVRSEWRTLAGVEPGESTSGKPSSGTSSLPICAAAPFTFPAMWVPQPWGSPSPKTGLREGPAGLESPPAAHAHPALRGSLPRNRYLLDRSLGQEVQEGGRKEQVTERHRGTIAAWLGLGEPPLQPRPPLPSLDHGRQKELQAKPPTLGVTQAASPLTISLLAGVPGASPMPRRTQRAKPPGAAGEDIHMGGLPAHRPRGEDSTTWETCRRNEVPSPQEGRMEGPE